VPDLFTPYQGETLMAFLQRTRPQYDWQDNDGTAEPYAQVDADQYQLIPSHYVRPRLTSAEFAAAVATIYPPPPDPISLPPFYNPNHDYQISDPEPLADQLVLHGPIFGVFVDITTPPTRTGRYLVGGQTYDYGVGMITFSQQDEYLEPWQYMGFRKAIYVPKTMSIASHVYFRVLAGAEGTVKLIYQS